ncbi:MAG: hypothetical protein ACHQIG_07650 [Acidimicrobiia bacterium]
MSIDRSSVGATARNVLSKVPEVTIFFWIIKILATTIGETAADYLADNLGFGLTGTTWIMSALLVGVLVFQFRAPRYVPIIYWLVVVVLSIVGTLVTDNLTDKYNVALETTTVIFAIALAVTFTAWYLVERTLSIHSIYTPRREAFYWLAILFTFALGTASGDLIAERYDVGYWKAALLFGGCIGLITIAWRYLNLNPILAFWMAYILTRPLGASIGDFLSQPKDVGGLGLGTTTTSLIFLTAIAVTVGYLTKTKKDQIVVVPAGDQAPRTPTRLDAEGHGS